MRLQRNRALAAAPTIQPRGRCSLRHSDICCADGEMQPQGPPGAELEEKDSDGNEKGRQWCRPLRLTLRTQIQPWLPPPFWSG